MIVCPTVRKEDIRSHYNLATLFYRLLWGRHIHHGLWSADETASVAQQKLTETLAREAGIKAAAKKCWTLAAAWDLRRFTWSRSSIAR